MTEIKQPIIADIGDIAYFNIKNLQQTLILIPRFHLAPKYMIDLQKVNFINSEEHKNTTATLSF